MSRKSKELPSPQNELELIPANIDTLAPGQVVFFCAKGRAGFSDLYKQLDGQKVFFQRKSGLDRALIRIHQSLVAAAISNGRRLNIHHEKGDIFSVPTWFLFVKENNTWLGKK